MIRGAKAGQRVEVLVDNEHRGELGTVQDRDRFGRVVVDLDDTEAARIFYPRELRRAP